MVRNFIVGVTWLIITFMGVTDMIEMNGMMLVHSNLKKMKKLPPVFQNQLKTLPGGKQVW